MTETNLYFDGKPGSRKRAMEKRRIAILHSALDVFSQKGFYRTDLEEIATLAHVSKGSIYNHFTNKKDLFVKTLEWGVEKMTMVIDDRLQQVHDPYERLVTVVRFYFEFFDNNAEFFRVLIWEGELFENFQHERSLTRLLEKRQRKVEELVQDCIDGGYFTGISSYDCAVMLLGASNGLIFDWIIHSYSGKLVEKVDILEKLIIKGFLK